jgi:hypothetical protein
MATVHTCVYVCMQARSIKRYIVAFGLKLTLILTYIHTRTHTHECAPDTGATHGVFFFCSGYIVVCMHVYIKNMYIYIQYAYICVCIYMCVCVCISSFCAYALNKRTCCTYDTQHPNILFHFFFY